MPYSRGIYNNIYYKIFKKVTNSKLDLEKLNKENNSIIEANKQITENKGKNKNQAEEGGDTGGIKNNEDIEKKVNNDINIINDNNNFIREDNNSSNMSNNNSNKENKESKNIWYNDTNNKNNLIRRFSKVENSNKRYSYNVVQIENVIFEDKDDIKYEKYIESNCNNSNINNINSNSTKNKINSFEYNKNILNLNKANKKKINKKIKNEDKNINKEKNNNNNYGNELNTNTHENCNTKKSTIKIKKIKITNFKRNNNIKKKNNFQNELSNSLKKELMEDKIKPNNSSDKNYQI